jgi:phospholipid-translocating ATPase
MIQAADVGVGIVGKEGKQAALAADFSILKFKNVLALLLWHGRLSYKRSALLSSFIIHRGFIISVIQLIFSCVFFYVSIPAFNSYLSLGFATMFTFWPVFSLILDTDIDVRNLLMQRVNAMKYPKLYDSLQSSNELSSTNFLAWLWKAGFQGSMIIILSLVFFMEDSYL